jgi:hypothetical protein
MELYEKILLKLRVKVCTGEGGIMRNWNNSKILAKFHSIKYLYTASQGAGGDIKIYFPCLSHTYSALLKFLLIKFDYKLRKKMQRWLVHFCFIFLGISQKIFLPVQEAESLGR